MCMCACVVMPLPCLFHNPLFFCVMMTLSWDEHSHSHCKRCRCVYVSCVCVCSNLLWICFRSYCFSVIASWCGAFKVACSSVKAYVLTLH